MQEDMELRKGRKEFIFTWSIRNFSHAWHETGEILKSHGFHPSPVVVDEFSMHLYPRGSHDSDYISLFLYGESISVSINFELSLVSADESEMQSLLTPETAVGGVYGSPCFLERHKIFGRQKALYLPNDTLTVRCRMWRYEGDTEKSDRKSVETGLMAEEIISEENVTLVNAEERTFDVHSKIQNKPLMYISISYLSDKLDVKISPNSEALLKFATLHLFLMEEKKTLCEFKSSFFGDWTEENLQLLLTDKSDGGEFVFKIQVVYSTGIVKHLVLYSVTKDSEFFKNFSMGCKKLAIYEKICDLYEKQDVCDIIIETTTSEKSVHKMVLCARSPVFLSNLRRNTGYRTTSRKEKYKMRLSRSALDTFLHFLYTDNDKIDELGWDDAMEVYSAAVTYQLERLKIFCCRYLRKNVDLDKLPELLDLGRKDFELRRIAADFALKNQILFDTSPKHLSKRQQKLAEEFAEWKRNEASSTPYEVRLSRIQGIKHDYVSYFGRAREVAVPTKGGRIFHTFRTVLGACSPKFKRMIHLNPALHILSCADWHEDTVSPMLTFLHTDKLEDIQLDTAVDLYELARTCEIDDLSDQCARIMVENLSVSNAIHFLQLTCKYGDRRLMVLLRDYICMHDEQIFASDDWATFSIRNGGIANQIMCAKYRTMKSFSVFN